MGEVIYETSPLQTYLLTLAVVAIFLILGLIGVLNGIFRRKEKVALRIARGCAGIFFAVLGLAFGLFALRSSLTAADTITVRLNDKQIAKDNCDTGICERYVLETQSGSNLYDIQVDEEAYQKAQIDSCYLVTYRSGKALFGDQASSDSYSSITNATRIETTTCR